MPGVGGGNLQNGPNNQQQVRLFSDSFSRKKKKNILTQICYLMLVIRAIINGGIIVFDLFKMTFFYNVRQIIPKLSS